MLKKAYSVQMSYDVTDDEKMIASKAILRFKHTTKLLDMASDYLNIVNTPFKDNPDMTKEDIFKTRVALRRFRDEAIDKFNIFKDAAYKCVSIMENFSSDTQTVKLMKSFINSIDDLEKKVNEFADLFNDLESQDFSKKIVEEIDKVKDQCKDVNSIINERIKSHIQTNILASNWTNEVGNRLQTQINKKKPLILSLFDNKENELDKEFNDILNERS